MRSTRIALALLVLAAAVVLSCSKKSSPTAPGGGAVTETFNSGNVGPGGSFVHTFTTAGTFRYHCSIHGTQTSGMFGDIVVSAGGGDSATVTTPGISFSAQSPGPIKPGGYIHWMISGTTHTVTRP